MKGALHERIEPLTFLRDGFWRSPQIEATMEDLYVEECGIREEFVGHEAFVGQLRDRPLQSFRVDRDLFARYYVAIRLADGDTGQIWIARALSNPNCNSEKPNCVLIQYFRPTSRDQNV